ncbi:MAG: hypothetical protein ACOVQM_21295 [Pirellula sp.]|jgi:hypothetical protein
MNAKEAKKRIGEYRNGEALLCFLNLPVAGLANSDVPLPDLIYTRCVGDRVGIEVTKVFEHNLPSQKIDQKESSLADDGKGAVQLKAAHVAEASFAAFQQFAPGTDVGIDLSKEYQIASGG